MQGEPLIAGRGLVRTASASRAFGNLGRRARLARGRLRVAGADRSRLDRVGGGLGADTLHLAFENSGDNSPAAYPPVGAALLDGGYGTDACTVVGAAAPVLAHLVSCE